VLGLKSCVIGITFDQLLSALNIIFLLAVLVTVINSGQAVAYEINIYNCYPLYLWLFIALVYVTGIIVLLRYVFDLSSHHKYWLIGVLSIVIVNTILLTIPVIRGYFFYGVTDASQYYGFTKDIETFGHFFDQTSVSPLGNATYTPVLNVYPAFSILAVFLSSLTGINSRTISMLLPAFFFAFYQLFVFLIARKMDGNLKRALFVLAFALPSLFLSLQSMAIPTVFTFFSIPFILYVTKEWLTDNSGKARWLLLVTIILIVLPFEHPGDAISVLLVLIAAEFFLVKKALRVRAFLTVFGIAITTWFIRIYSLGIFTTSLHSLFGRSFVELSYYTSIIERSNVSTLKVVTVFLSSWGQVIIYSTVAGIILISLLSLVYRKKNISSYSFPAALFIIFIVLTPVFMLTPGIGSFRRVLFYAIFGSTLLLGFYLYDRISRVRFRGALTYGLSILLIVVILICVFNVHDSPYIRSYNEQITKTNVLGMSFFLDNNEGLFFVDQIRVMQYSLSAINIGNELTPRNIRWGVSEQYQPPDHFGYTSYQQFGQAIGTTHFLLANKLDEQLLPTVFPDFEGTWRWTPEDWHRLQFNDPSVNRVYDNNDFIAYYISSK
jgi:hypothetical protein